MFKSLLILCLCPLGLLAQIQTLPLTDLSAFKKTENNWKIVGKVAGNYTAASLQSEAGTGILLNQPAAPKTYGDKYELYSQFEHGDIALSLDFMLPKGANSGIYLQSRYEIQLFDSWGVLSVFKF